MSKTVVFTGVLSNNASQNPDFYNWNKVRLRYCDGASFAGDSQFGNGVNKLACSPSQTNFFFFFLKPVSITGKYTERSGLWFF
jgi:hypothetical protein